MLANVLFFVSTLTMSGGCLEADLELVDDFDAVGVMQLAGATAAPVIVASHSNGFLLWRNGSVEQVKSEPPSAIALSDDGAKLFMTVASSASEVDLVGNPANVYALSDPVHRIAAGRIGGYLPGRAFSNSHGLIGNYVIVGDSAGSVTALDFSLNLLNVPRLSSSFNVSSVAQTGVYITLVGPGLSASVLQIEGQGFGFFRQVSLPEPVNGVSSAFGDVVILVGRKDGLLELDPRSGKVAKVNGASSRYFLVAALGSSGFVASSAEELVLFRRASSCEVVVFPMQERIRGLVVSNGHLVSVLVGDRIRIFRADLK